MNKQSKPQILTFKLDQFLEERSGCPDKPEFAAKLKDWSKK